MGTILDGIFPGSPQVQVTTPTVKGQIPREQWNVGVLLIRRAPKIYALQVRVDQNLSPDPGKICLLQKFLTDHSGCVPSHAVTADHNPSWVHSVHLQRLQKLGGGCYTVVFHHRELVLGRLSVSEVEPRTRDYVRCSVKPKGPLSSISCLQSLFET